MRKPQYFAADTKHDRWLISYVDIVTILLILFVALAAQAVQHPTFVQSALAMSKTTVASLANQTKTSPAVAIAKERLQRQGVELHVEPRGLVISLPQAVLFPPGQDQVAEEALPMVSAIANVLRDVPNRLLLVGHADSSPIHNKRFRNNWELSAARSLRLLELLTSRYDIPEDRLSTAGQGSYSPRGTNETVDGRAANRRVEIVILNDEPSQPEPRVPEVRG